MADVDVLRTLTDWVAANHAQRSFLIRSRHGSRELWVEISEGRSKFEIPVPLSDLGLLSEAVDERIARFVEIRDTGR
jgi:hypothetical protein